MYLADNLKKTYTRDTLSAREAQDRAEWIAFGPFIFQVARLMHQFGILAMLRDSDRGMTRSEIAAQAGLSDYAAKVLLEASLTMQVVIVDPETERFSLAKTGWFLLTDALVRVNMDFNHDVNYEGLFALEAALKEGSPAGLAHFGDWPTVYEGLSQLPPQVQQSWFAFDHFYSDSSFDEALKLIFSGKTRHLLDVGGNTGRWAMRCVQYDPEVRVTIVDLPQQLAMMRAKIQGQPGSDRIDGCALNLLDPQAVFPERLGEVDAIWMSQFLDCFGEEEIVGILERAAGIMRPQTRLYIMETFWDRQKYDTAAFCLTQISLYFTAIANGNSKMYHSDDMQRLVERAGLAIESLHDGLGHGHSIMVCRLK